MTDFSHDTNVDPKKNYMEIKFGEDAPLLETELNEMQRIQNEARASILREQVHSGVIQVLGITNSKGAPIKGEVHTQSPKDIWNSGSVSSSNVFRLGVHEALINGYKINIAGENHYDDNYNNITLPEPPTEGTRDDLVFLEAWFENIDATEDGSIVDSRVGVETSRRRKLNWRIRTIAGANFDADHPEGLGHVGGGTTGNTAFAQGGASEVSEEHHFRYVGYSGYADNPDLGKFNDDKGIYVAGLGYQASKDALQTADGYVYAIPMFRVKRRNNGGYSVNNGNGARNYPVYRFKDNEPSRGLNPGDTYELELEDGLSTEDFETGDVLGTPGYERAKVISILSETRIRLEVVNETDSSLIATEPVIHYLVNPRPDGLYANIIDERDIIDLRHKVSLTGYNYDQLLEENFDKLLRGELQTKDKEQMVKTYHGIPKTPIDSNTVFYASFDGTTEAEVGGALTPVNSLDNFQYRAHGTGLGLLNTDSLDAFIALPVSGLSSNEGTVDVLIDTSEYSNASGVTNNYHGIVQLRSADKYNLLSLRIHDSSGTIQLHHSSDVENIDSTGFVDVTGELQHIRLSWDSDSVYMYSNGVLKRTTANTMYAEPAYLDVNGSSYVGNGDEVGSAGGIAYVNRIPIADLSISSIDRGDNFATLPQDFIDGHARIMPAFDKQRKIQSDAQTSQTTKSLANPSDQSSDRGLTVEKGSGTNATIWEQGDTIAVKGLAGEVISGVIDSDTALAKITGSPDINNMTLDDVSSLEVGDTFSLRRGNEFSSTTYTVTAIDSETNTVTTQENHSDQMIKDGWEYIYETTASSSSPVVKWDNAGTLETVAGTWTDLGTNEAVFTVGDIATNNPDLDTETIRIEYSLNMPAGEGGLPEVYTDTLAGEWNGDKLKKDNVILVDDFAGKVSDSYSPNPHMLQYYKGQELFDITSKDFTNPADNVTQNSYDRITMSDAEISSYSANVDGEMAQQIFSFNVIEAIERKYPTFFRDCLTLGEKVYKASNEILRVKSIWKGYAENPNGNDVVIARYSYGVSEYKDGQSHSKPYVHTIVSSTTNPENHINPDGFAHFLVYTDPSDGVTASTIYTDYVSLEIELEEKAGYDLLVPENPRRDAGTSGILYVRKGTKELETFLEADEDYGVVTYGDYVPYQGIGDVANGAEVLSVSDQALVTNLGTQVKINSDFVNLGAITPKLPSPSPDYTWDTEKFTNSGSDRTYMSSLQVIKNDYVWLSSDTRMTLREGVRLSPYSNNESSYRGSKRRFALETDNVTDGSAQSIVKFKKMSEELPQKGLISLPMIVSSRGDLYIVIVSYSVSRRNELDYYSTVGVQDTFKIPGNPLVKGGN